MATPGKLLRVFQMVATVALLAAGGVYLWTRRAELGVLADVTAGELALLALFLFAFFVSTGATFYLLAGMLAVRLTTLEWLGLTFLSNAMNYLAPIRPGVMVKAAYLKKRKGMAYARFSAVLAANGLLLFLYTGLAGLALLFAVWLDRGMVAPVLVLICVALVALAVVPWVIDLSRLRWSGRLWQFFDQALAGFAEIRTRRGRILGVGLTVLAQYLFSALCSLVSFRALGFELDLLTALFLGVFASIANFLTLTPNNLGLQEVVMAYLYSITGHDFASGLLGAGLVRALHILMTFALAPLATYLLLKSEKLSIGNLLDDAGAAD